MVCYASIIKEGISFSEIAVDEHSESLRQKEFTCTELSAKLSFAASSSLSSGYELLFAMNPGDDESRNQNFPTGGVD